MKLYFLIVFVCLNCLAYSQPAYQDCIGAIPICQDVYYTASYTAGEGLYTELDASANPCEIDELNSTWYTFTPQNNGLLGFLITPNDLTDDYDWGLFDITGLDCNSLNNPLTFVTCNNSGSSPEDAFNCNGITGCDGSTTQTWAPPGCDGSFSPLNNFANVYANHTYVLLINNWTGSTNGYTIDFSSSTASIYDNTPPIFELPLSDVCLNQTTISLSTNEQFLVSTLSTNGSEFLITGPSAVTITGASNGESSSPYYSNTVNISIDNLTVAGTYTLQFQNGSDGNTLSDKCNNFMSNITTTFEAIPTPTVAFSIDKYEICEGERITLSDNSSFTPDEYTWQDNGVTISNASQPIITLNTAGLHVISLLVNYSNCGILSASRNVLVNPIPTFSFDGVDVDCDEPTIRLNADTGLDNVSYSWSTGESSQQIEMSTTTEMVICTTERKGCTYTDNLVVGSRCNLFIPNAFSPNDDNLNDFLAIYGNNISTINISIYNRWGEKLFESSDVNNQWNGKYLEKICPIGVYVFIASITFTDGFTLNKKGNISLLK